MSRRKWLVENMAKVPLLVIPCYEPYLPRIDVTIVSTGDAVRSIFPAVWNFQLALHTRGYGTCVTTLHLHREDEFDSCLGIPPTYVQAVCCRSAACVPGHTFSPAVRHPSRRWSHATRWDGPSL